MSEERNGIFKNSSFTPVVYGFVAIILLALILGWLFLRSGHPAMHVEPQPQNNKGAVALGVAGANA